MISLFAILCRDMVFPATTRSFGQKLERMGVTDLLFNLTLCITSLKNSTSLLLERIRAFERRQNSGNIVSSRRSFSQREIDDTAVTVFVF